MIEQELYIALLELFDEIEREEVFVEYKKMENVILNDEEICSLVNQHNDICDNLKNIEYQPFVEEQEKKLDEIITLLNQNEDYQLYLSLYERCNDRLVELANLVFKDIVEVKEMMCCAHK